jgi:hypothetical protein
MKMTEEFNIEKQLVATSEFLKIVNGDKNIFAATEQTVSKLLYMEFVERERKLQEIDALFKRLCTEDERNRIYGMLHDYIKARLGIAVSLSELGRLMK